VISLTDFKSDEKSTNKESIGKYTFWQFLAHLPISSSGPLLHKIAANTSNSPLKERSIPSAEDENVSVVVVRIVWF
jgi:hypothetical protein